MLKSLFEFLKIISSVNALQMQKLLKDNEGSTDIEKLSHHEFDLDTEEQTKLHAEGDVQIAKVRRFISIRQYYFSNVKSRINCCNWFTTMCGAQMKQEKDVENLSKLFLYDVIKRECWDSMEVKGRGIVVRDLDFRPCF